jgi:hypothetical protein
MLDDIAGRKKLTVVHRANFPEARSGFHIGPYAAAGNELTTG